MTYPGLIGVLLAEGALPEEWREAFDAVPRPAFVPDVIWRETADGWVSTSRADHPGEWAEKVCSDLPVTTQVDDGATPVGRAGHQATSSTSAPSVMARMLDQLDVRAGHRVLEIGTGTG